MAERRVDKLRPGQEFIWCGRVVRISRFEHVGGKRPGRWIVGWNVTDDEPVRLNYYLAEFVELAPPETVEEGRSDGE